MRWFVLIALCLVAIASAKFVKENKNRVGRMLKTIADDLIDDFDGDSDFQDSNWSDEYDSEMDSQEDQPWLQKRHIDQQQHRRQQQQKKQKKHCVNCERKQKWNQDEEDDEDFDESPYEREQHRVPLKHKKQHQRGQEYQEYEEAEEPCQPNYDLLRRMDQVNHQLAAKLHRQAKHNTDDRNTVVSPVAVQLALAAVNQGARGNTKRQISQLLDFGLPKNQNQNAYSALARILKGQGHDEHGGKSLQIKTTTGVIMGQQSAQEKFVNAIKKCFDGEVKRCDFRTQPQQCRHQINEWISSKTGHKSQNILPEHGTAKITRMIAVGTMQAKANWGKQFRKNLKTVQGRFYALGDQQPTPVKMLQTEGEFNYFEDNDMQVLACKLKKSN